MSEAVLSTPTGSFFTVEYADDDTYDVLLLGKSFSEEHVTKCAEGYTVKSDLITAWDMDESTEDVPCYSREVFIGLLEKVKSYFVDTITARGEASKILSVDKASELLGARLLMNLDATISTVKNSLAFVVIIEYEDAKDLGPVSDFCGGLQFYGYGSELPEDLEASYYITADTLEQAIAHNRHLSEKHMFD